jgi:hypothetical protein
MKGSRGNTFRKAIHHLKSNQIDEKLQLLSEIPTNSTSGIYVVEPEYQVQDPDVPGSEPVDFTQDDPALNGRDTTGLFGEDGSILTIEPPGDTSYVLGPMMSMWYAWGNFSTIGYVRQSDRRMVDLGRITGQIGSWDGLSNFVSYGQLTLEQANWFKDQSKIQYRAFYPGPPSNPADEFGRYLGDMISEGKPTSTTPPPRRVPPELGGFDPNIPPGEANPKKKKRDDEIAYGQDEYGKSDYGQKPDGTRGMPRPGELNKGSDGKWYEYVPGSGWQGIPSVGVRSASNRKDNDSQVAQNNWPSGKDAKPSETTPVIPPWGGGPVVPGGRDFQGPSPNNKYPMAKNKKGKNKTQVAHYEPEGKVLSESKKSILKNIKKPYVLPEQPKVRFKHKPKVNRTINADLMKRAEVPSSFKKAEDRMWGKYEKNKNTRMSQEKKNEVLDHLGGSDHFWEFMTETSRKKNNDIMYGNFGGKKVVRKEELKGDTLLFIADENGKKESILQSELSIRLANQFNKELFEKYFSEQETTNVDKDPLFKKLSKRLKKEINYSDKPSKKGYPNDPPPEMVNGWHPDYGKDKGYYNKLDPQSAKSMPSTDNPEIDKKVKSARSNQK